MVDGKLCFGGRFVIFFYADYFINIRDIKKYAI